MCILPYCNVVLLTCGVILPPCNVIFMSCGVMDQTYAVTPISASGAYKPVIIKP